MANLGYPAFFASGYHMLLVNYISSQTSGNCEAIGLSIHQGDEMLEDGKVGWYFVFFGDLHDYIYTSSSVVLGNSPTFVGWEHLDVFDIFMLLTWWSEKNSYAAAVL